jgi:hypothetical protein
MNAIVRWTFARSLSRVCGIGMTASVIALSNVNAQTATVPSSTEKAVVDALIPWLLQEDAQLRGIPFSEVIFDSTGKHVFVFHLLVLVPDLHATLLAPQSSARRSSRFVIPNREDDEGPHNRGLTLKLPCARTHVGGVPRLCSG